MVAMFKLYPIRTTIGTLDGFFEFEKPFGLLCF